MKRVVLWVALAAVAATGRGAAEFEILPLVDEGDWNSRYDIESPTGMVQTLEEILKVHPTTILWRDKAAGRCWIPSREERSPYGEHPLDKRLIPCCGSFGYLRLDRTGFATIPLMREEGLKRGVGFGLHTGYEENHQIPCSEPNWNLMHPEFACRIRSGMPRLACVSLAFPEVRAHKLRFLDDRLALKPEIVFLDLHRAGGWSVDLEDVRPVCDRWRAKYGCEPPENAKDPRWIALCSEDVMDYLRTFGAKCRTAGTRFLFGIQKVEIGYDYMWERYGIDWKRLAQEGAIDGLVVMGVKPDANCAFESTKEILSYVRANSGTVKMYFQASSYRSNNGFNNYKDWTKLDTVTCMKRMIAIAKEVGCSGVILECVDPGHYAPQHCEVLKEAYEGRKIEGSF